MSWRLGAAVEGDAAFIFDREVVLGGGVIRSRMREGALGGW